MKVDLHVHTLESDGILTVEEVVTLAHENQVQMLGITDHESTEGIARAQRMGKSLNVEIMPGVELLTDYQGNEVHLLGYFKDINQPVLQARLQELRNQRTALAREMVTRLQASGLALQWQDVEREVHSVGAVSKGHIMRAIYKSQTGSNRDWRKIAKYFRAGGVANMPFRQHSFTDAVDLILTCGGLPVVAHPGLLYNPQIVPDLLAYRTIGLEVYYGYWENRDLLISHYAEVAARLAVLATGGSDYHGPAGFIKIGQMDVPWAGIEKLIAYLK